MPSSLRLDGRNTNSAAGRTPRSTPVPNTTLFPSGPPDKQLPLVVVAGVAFRGVPVLLGGRLPIEALGGGGPGEIEALPCDGRVGDELDAGHVGGGGEARDVRGRARCEAAEQRAASCVDGP